MKQGQKVSAFSRFLAVALLLITPLAPRAFALDAVLASPLPSPTASGTSAACNVLCSDISANPNDVGLQQATQCIAYKSAAQGRTFDYVILAMEGVALASCATACASSGVNMGTLDAVCKYVGMTASAAEMIRSLTMKNTDGTEKAMGLLSGALGAGASAGGAGALLSKFSGVDISATDPDGLNYITVTDPSTGQAYAPGVQKSAAQNQRIAACASAAFLAISIANRMASIKSQNATQVAACQAVQSLASNGAAYNAATGTYNSQSAGLVGATATPNAIISTGVQAGLTCVASTGLQGCAAAAGLPNASAATDSGALVASGSTPGLANAAQALVPGLVGAIQSGASAGNIAGQAAGGGGLGAALSTLAAAAEAAGPLEDTGTQVASLGAAGGGGGGHASGGGDADLNSVMGMFNKGADGKSAPGASRELAFAPNSDGDIWHRNTKGTIFDIVSRKTAAVKGRVQQLDFASPANRVMNGLSAYGH